MEAAGLAGAALVANCAEPEPFAQESELTFRPESTLSDDEPDALAPPGTETPAESEPNPEPEPVTNPSTDPAMPPTGTPPIGSVTEDAGSPDVPEPLPPPSITAFSGERGVWGDTIVITGASLGSASREGVSLNVGAELTLQPDDDAVLSWTETQIEFRIAFPHEGTVSLVTPEGEAVAGSFESEWRLGPAFPVASGAEIIASVSEGPGAITFALDTLPITILSFDGNEWSELALGASDVVPSTFRLYLNDDGDVEAFALAESDATLVVFDEASGYAPSMSEFQIGPEFALAGGPDGAVVWHTSELGWQRLSASSSGWMEDGGPFEDPNPSLDLHTAVATNDGSLFLLHAADTGNFLDDLGAPFFYRLGPSDTEFSGPTRGGRSVDDFLTSLAGVDRGRGFLVEFCGSDIDPFAVTGTAYRCYSAAHSSAGDFDLDGLKESDGALHAFTNNRVGVAYCDGSDNTRLSADRSNTLGSVMTWPCMPVEALEIDVSARWVPVVRHEDAFYPLTAAERADIDFGPEDNLGMDAGRDGGTTGADGSVE